MRFHLDVNPRRASLQQTLTVSYAGGVVEIEVADLDTGSAWGLVGPRADIRLPEDHTRPHVNTLGGRLRAFGFEGLLRLAQGEHLFEIPRVEIVVHDQWDRWLLGMQVLRRFHLLMPHEVLATEDELQR